MGAAHPGAAAAAPLNRPPPLTRPVQGLLLAAGAGTRLGRPKALLTDEEGRPVPEVVVDRLRSAGCRGVTVVLGARASDARRTLATRDDLTVTVAEDWAEGIGASLRHGLTVCRETSDAVAVLVTLVDLPDVTSEVMRRVLARWSSDGAAPNALVRATYGGRPGHPVLIGREHWAPLVQTLVGDDGAQRYLARRRVVEVSCEDLATGRDVDLPEDLR